MQSQQRHDVPERMGTMSSLYSIGLMNELADGLEADGFTSEEVKALISSGRLRGMKSVVEGRAEIKVHSILHRLYENETVKIAPTTGVETLAEAKNFFTGFLDSSFKNWGTDVPSSPTTEQVVEVHEMVQDGNFKTIFGSTSRPLDTLLLTQGQIKVFCRDHRDKLRTDGYGTFFAFKVGEEILPDLSNIFVANVYVVGRDLDAFVFRFSYEYVWYGDYRHRVVIPQLTPKS